MEMLEGAVRMDVWGNGLNVWVHGARCPDPWESEELASQITANEIHGDVTRSASV